MTDVARRPAGPAPPLPRASRRPGERFLAAECAGGLVLIVAALVASVRADPPWAGLYGHPQAREAGGTVGGAGLHPPLAPRVNAAPMAAFPLASGEGGVLDRAEVGVLAASPCAVVAGLRPTRAARGATGGTGA